MPNFLDIFTYDSFTNNPNDGTGSTCFNNCVMIRDFGDLKKGQKIHWLASNINLLGGFNDNGVDIDETEIYMEEQINVTG